MMKHSGKIFLNLALILGFCLATLTCALAISTTPTNVTTSAWVSLGAGPMQIAVISGVAKYQISDSQPSPGSLGFPVPSVLAQGINTTSQIWVIAVGSVGSSNAIVLSAPVTAAAVASSGSGSCSNSFDFSKSCNSANLIVSGLL